MSGTEPLLDRRAIEDAFRRLGDRLVRRGVVADVYVFGGAAMALAYDARRATRDIDAVFEPHGIVLEAARAVANELGLPDWWLNQQASSYVAPGGDPSAPRVFDHPGLRVAAASPEHLLAMKVLAARRRDFGGSGSGGVRRGVPRRTGARSSTAGVGGRSRNECLQPRRRGLGRANVLPGIRREHVGVVGGGHVGEVGSPAGRLLGGACWSGCRGGAHSVVTSVTAARAEDSSTMLPPNRADPRCCPGRPTRRERPARLLVGRVPQQRCARHGRSQSQRRLTSRAAPLSSTRASNHLASRSDRREQRFSDH